MGGGDRPVNHDDIAIVDTRADHVCYLELGKFSNNLHYVDYERLPIEEFSENGRSIPHNGVAGYSHEEGADWMRHA